MAEIREQTVTGMLKQIQPLIEKLNNELKSDDFAYNRIVWDIEAKQRQREKLAENIILVEQQIEEKKKQAEAIIDMAKEEANRILSIAREKNVEAEKKLIESKRVMEEAIEKKYKKEKEKVGA